MTFEAINYTQGAYDIVDIVKAPDTNVVLGYLLRP